VIEGSVPSDSAIHLYGVVRGLASEREPLRRGLEDFAPAAVGVGVSVEELESLREQFIDQLTEPFVPLLASEAVEVRELSRFGEVSLPNPGMIAAIEWAQARHVPVVALDPDDSDYSEMFTAHISYFELVGRTVRERRLVRSPPPAISADELVLTWDARLRGRGGSARLAAAKEANEAAQIRALRAANDRVAAVVDRERFLGVLGQFEGPFRRPSA
jgi:hypothetical protein